jgi:predicted transposase/invertase (TIGR01784 family)
MKETDKRFNPLNDFLFLKTFGEKGDEEQLLALLNAVLSTDGSAVLTDINIQEGRRLTARYLQDKASELDVFATTKDLKVNIEVQLRNQYNMDKRSLYYWSKLYNEAQKGEDYKELPKVITINILDFDFLGTKRFHSCFHIREDVERDYVLSDVLEMHFIEMPKFREFYEKDINNPLHRMLMYLDINTDNKLLKKIIRMDKTIEKIHSKTQRMMRSQRAYRNYILRERSIMDWNSSISGAREEGMTLGLQKGMTLGVQKGRLSGLQEGRLSGLQEGRLSGLQEGMVKGIDKRNAELISRCIAKGYTAAQIAELLDMPVESVVKML